MNDDELTAAYAEGRRDQLEEDVKVLQTMHFAQLGRGTEHNHFAVAARLIEENVKSPA